MIIIRQLYQRAVEIIIGIGMLCWGLSLGYLSVPMHHLQFYSALADVMALIADPRTGFERLCVPCGLSFAICSILDWKIGRRLTAIIVATLWSFIGLGLWRDGGFVPGVFSYWTLASITAITALGIPGAPRRA